VLRQAPDDWPTVQRLADLRAREGSTRRAVELFRRLAEHYEADHHLPRAIAVWRIVLRHDPGFVGVHVKLGGLYERQGFRVESRHHYEAAAAGFAAQGRPREASLARRALESAREGAPARPLTDRPGAGGEGGAPSPEQEELLAERLVEARMYRRYNLPRQARAALETVLGLVPDHPEARAELAELERDEEDRTRAEKLANPPATGTGDPKAEPGSVDGHLPAGPNEDRDLESLGFAVGRQGSPDEDERCPSAAAGAEGAPGGPGDLVLPGLFDDVLTDAEPADGEAAVSAGIPSIFRQHVESQIAPEDYGARYDLGIAYREMGLVDEAIAELQLASRDPGRFVDCASLLAGCFLEKGLPALAVRWLERGLATVTPRDAARHALQYELGHALETAGEARRALETFTELYGEAAGHRDVAARVQRLRAGSGQTTRDPGVKRER
jgi:tetratricopeptide (TPR) repeat protein